MKFSEKCKYQWIKSCVFSAVVTFKQEAYFDGVPMDHESGFPTLDAHVLQRGGQWYATGKGNE